MTSVIVISLLQFGQISVVGTTEHASLVLMTFPFARRNVGASEKAHPGLGACQSEKARVENWPGRFATAARSSILCAYYPQESRKKTAKAHVRQILIRASERSRESLPFTRFLEVKISKGELR